MALSMTGFGRGVKTVDNYTVTIDLKSVNHRYLEFFFKVQKAYSYLEEKLRKEISTRISRGKVEVVINIERFVPLETRVNVNQSLVASYLKAIQEIQNEFHLGGNIEIQSLITLPDIFKTAPPEEEQDKLTEITFQALDEALSNLIVMRRTEGSDLCKNISSKLELLEEYRLNLLSWAPNVVTSYQERLVKRIQELTTGVEPDPNRLAIEVAIFADKSDITEELVRIKSHLDQFSRILNLSEPVGRRLDFLVQELHREINTIGSKANDLKIAQVVIDFKTELEKIREQIQNVE